MSSKTGKCYLLCGPDRSSKLERVSRLAQDLGLGPLDVHRVSADEIPTPDLLSLIRQHPMQGPLRLIVIDEANRLDEACLQALAERWGEFQQTACVVLLMDVDAEREETPSWKALRSGAVVERFGGTAAGAPDHFAWLNAIAQRNAASALRMLHGQLSVGKEPLELLGLLVWQLQRWLTLAHLLAAGASRQEMETVTGWKPWQIQRVGEELKGQSAASLQRALEACWQLDVQAKSGRLPALTTALEQLVVRLCLGAGASSGAR